WSDYDDAVTLSASRGTVTKNANGTWSWTGTDDEDHPYTVTITATNADGSLSTTAFDVSFSDVAPMVGADSPAVSAAENAAASNSGTWADYDDAVTLSASQDTGSTSGNGTCSSPRSDD